MQIFYNNFSAVYARTINNATNNFFISKGYLKISKYYLLNNTILFFCLNNRYLNNFNIIQNYYYQIKFLSYHFATYDTNSIFLKVLEIFQVVKVIEP